MSLFVSIKKYGISIQDFNCKTKEMKKIFLAALLTLLLADEVFCANNIEIVLSDQTSIILKLKPIDISFVDVQINGSRFQKIEAHDNFAYLNKPGFPNVPVICVLLGIPFSSSPEVRILESQFEEISDVSLCPAPNIFIEENEQGGSVSEKYQIDQEIYSSDKFFPSSLAEIAASQIVRDQKVVKLQIYPVQFNPQKKIIRKYANLKIEIVYNPGQQNQKQNVILLPNDPFESVYQKALVNYSVAKNWQKKSNKVKIFSGQGNWHNPDYLYYKLYISKDDVYHLSYDDLLSYNIPLDTFDPRTIKVYYLGQEIPIRVAGEEDGVFDSFDFIEFYGQQKHGDDSYYDDYTNTNVYWLTLGGANGKRFAEQQSLTGNFAELTKYRETIHIEKDLSFYHGDESKTIIDTEEVPGEGWIWKRFYRNDEYKFSTLLNNVDSETMELCTLKVFLRGTTIDTVNPDHWAQFEINNNQIGEVSFDGREEIVYTATFENSLLKNGLNNVAIKSIETGAEINSFYFDWMELTYPATVQFADNKLKFDVEKKQDARISLWNLTSDTISVYNLTQHYFISNYELKNEQQFIFKLFSAGFDDGNFAQIEINSDNTIRGGNRGHNIAVFDTSTGVLVDTRWFDTLDKTENSDSMAAYILRIDEDKIVMVAIRDEGSYRMTEAAYLAMESLGGALTRQVGFRDSYVLLGRKGAEKGTVPELLVPAGQGNATLIDTLFTYHQDLKHLTFQDHFIENEKYFIATIDSMLKPDSVIVDQYRNLRNAENGADYIFITHKNFRFCADKFAAFWAARNYRTKLLDIEDIYDEFNYGIKNAKAIKEFLTFSYQNWQQPAPIFVLLIGDASWDPKKNSPTSVKQDYVPTYGNPVTDNWFVCFDGEDDVLPDMFIGRLAIETNEMGEQIFNKVEKYAALPSADWKKQLLFINGGFNDTEQIRFGSQTTGIINKYVTPPPSSCVPVVISKELDGLYEGEKREEIIEAINKGKLWVNFIGHGGSGTWELMFHDEQIFQLENSECLPFVTSLTCHTGRFANPEITNFGENFVNYSEAGAIGFVGTSGWGFVYEDDQFANKLFETVLKDTVHQLGKALAFSKIKLWGALSNNVYTKSVIYQYAFLGDPAINLTLPDKPDLIISESSVNWAPLTPVEDDSLVQFNVKIFNYGMATVDSVQLKITDNFKSAAAAEIFNRKIQPIGYLDSITVPLEISDKAGEHSLEFTIDPDNVLAEADETNNRITTSLFVGSSRITVSMPKDNQIVTELNPRLQINNPASDTENPGYYFEIDTTTNFNSNALIQSESIPEGIIVTKWQPQLQKNTLYFWRCRKTEDSIQDNWVSSCFKMDDNFGWTQQEFSQFKDNKFVNTELIQNGIQLLLEKTIFRVESSGRDDLDVTVIFINSNSVADARRGHNIAVCDVYGNIVEFQSFDSHDSPEDVAAMVEFLNVIPTNYYVLAGIKDSGAQSMTEAAYLALEQIGSQYCRDVRFRDGWAIIGKKGAAIGSVPEKLVKRFEGAVIVNDTLKNYNPTGEIFSTEIGPSNGWNQLFWEVSTPSSETKILLDVIAYNKNTSNWDTLFTNLSNSSGETLSAIEAKNYPLIKLKGNLSSQDRLTTPLLQNWKVAFEPVSDIAIKKKVVEFSSDTLIEGSLLKISADVYNVGHISEDSVAVKLYYKNANNETRLIEKITLVNIEVNSFKSFIQHWDSKGNVGVNQVLVEIDADDKINELSENNNLFSGQVVVLADTIEPDIVVSYDGRQIVVGDYVSQQPLILVEVYDDNPAQIENDTSRIHLLLDGERINYNSNEQVISLLSLESEADSSLKAKLRFVPLLTNGEHALEISVKDVSDNLVYQRDEFKVVSELQIINLFNYPNPFSDNTNFTFHLTQPVERVVIKIYTVAGRLIHKIERQNCEAGFQQIYWNGFDMDGDALANGVYLYKIIARAGSEQVEKIEKVLVMR